MTVAIGRATELGTFARGSAGTYFDADGLLKTAGPNVLRLTHDPATGKALGYLREEQATNLLPDSENFNAWNKLRAGIVSAAAMGPDGLMSADLLVPQAVADTHVVFRDVAVSTGLYTGSVFSRSAGVSAIRLHLAGAAIPAGAFADFNLVTGVVVNDGAAGTARIKRLRDGRYRCSIVGNATVAGNCRLHIWAWDLVNGLNFLGDGVSGVEIFGAQLEVDAGPTSYIKTGSGSAIRLEDNLDYDLPGTPEGTVVIEARTPAKTDGNRVLWSWDDGTSANAIFLYRSSTGFLAAVLVVNGVTVAAFNVAAVAADTDIKVALSWRQGQLAASLNGAAAAVSTSYLDPLPVLSKVRIGTRIGISRWASTVASARILPKSYDPADLQGMSAL